MSKQPKRLSVDEAGAYQSDLARRHGVEEFAVVANPSYVFPPSELYPLAPVPALPLGRLAGVVKDMDGTTTTTEPLCLHSLEWMTGRIGGRRAGEWPGLNRTRDYPHIIGNSTTKHVEYLVDTYGADFDARACLAAWIEAAVWTLAHGRDPGRRREVRANLSALGLKALLERPGFRELAEAKEYDAERVARFAKQAASDLLERFRAESPTHRVRAAVDIYYMRYHLILGDIADGRGEGRAREVLGSPEAHLIEPMPGIGPFLAALKGILGADLGLFADELIAHVREKGLEVDNETAARAPERLARLGERFERHPVPVAVVTSSIAYEAGIVLGEVFRVLREQAAQWAVAPSRREAALQRFESPHVFYDAVVTASDSSEIRLKPHRDLYSIALHALGLVPDDFASVVGFEDSESGVTAIRAAGVGLSVALPFADTAGHDLSAAARILPGQIPQALALENLFLQD